MRRRSARKGVPESKKVSPVVYLSLEYAYFSISSSHPVSTVIYVLVILRLIHHVVSNVRQTEPRSNVYSSPPLVFQRTRHQSWQKQRQNHFPQAPVGPPVVIYRLQVLSTWTCWQRTVEAPAIQDCPSSPYLQLTNRSVRLRRLYRSLKHTSRPRSETNCQFHLQSQGCHVRFPDLPLSRQQARLSSGTRLLRKAHLGAVALPLEDWLADKRKGRLCDRGFFQGFFTR